MLVWPSLPGAYDDQDTEKTLEARHKQGKASFSCMPRTEDPCLQRKEHCSTISWQLSAADQTRANFYCLLEILRRQSLTLFMTTGCLAEQGRSSYLEIAQPGEIPAYATSLLKMSQVSYLPFTHGYFRRYLRKKFFYITK